MIRLRCSLTNTR